MYEGGNVESLVSNTAYSFEKIDDKIKLRAEGMPVDFTYITKEDPCPKNFGRGVVY